VGPTQQRSRPLVSHTLDFAKEAATLPHRVLIAPVEPDDVFRRSPDVFHPEYNAQPNLDVIKNAR
jgi:hypothetical protein